MIFLIIFMLVLLPILLTKYKITNSTFVLIPFKDMGEWKGWPSRSASFPVHLASESQGGVSRDGLLDAAETNDPVILGATRCKHLLLTHSTDPSGPGKSSLRSPNCWGSHDGQCDTGRAVANGR